MDLLLIPIVIAHQKLNDTSIPTCFLESTSRIIKYINYILTTRLTLLVDKDNLSRRLRDHIESNFEIRYLIFKKNWFNYITANKHKTLSEDGA